MEEGKWRREGPSACAVPCGSASACSTSTTRSLSFASLWVKCAVVCVVGWVLVAYRQVLPSHIQR